MLYIPTAENNHAGMEFFFKYSRMIKQWIEKTIYAIDYHKLFPDILSPANIWNGSDDESDKEE